MKYNMRRQAEECEEEGDSDSEIQQLKQRIRLRRQQIQRSRLPPCTSSQHSKAAWDALTPPCGQNTFVFFCFFALESCLMKVFRLWSSSFPTVFHSTDSGGSRRSSQDSCHGLSDGSAEEVEECELQGSESHT